jgi:hypothetical protein
MTHKVTYQEQVSMGLIRETSNFVCAEIIPTARKIPSAITDPYAAGNASPVQYMVKHETTPESRAKAMVTKTNQVSLFLGLMTAAAMYVFSLYPLHWATVPIVLLWLVIASAEWLAAFYLLAQLDWKETPTAIEWRRTNGMLDLMKREQKARLMTVYGLSADEVKELDR